MKRKNYNTEKAEQIDELVAAYQAGDEEAGCELLTIYGADPRRKSSALYIGKYYKMLRYGKMIWNDKDCRMFMRCFFKDREILEGLNKPYQYEHVKKEVRKKLQYIEMSLRTMDDEDLLQELRILFLKQASRYKKTNRNFSAYLYNSYRYAVMNWIEGMQKKNDPYVQMPEQLLRIAEDCYEDKDGNIEINDSIFATEPMIMIDDALGNSWVRGITCGEEFKDLTTLQRLILKLHNHEGYSDGKIADMMGTHINTIFRQRKRAIATVQETVEQLKEEGYYQ